MTRQGFTNCSPSFATLPPTPLQTARERKLATMQDELQARVAEQLQSIKTDLLQTVTYVAPRFFFPRREKGHFFKCKPQNGCRTAWSTTPVHCHERAVAYQVNFFWTVFFFGCPNPPPPFPELCCLYTTLGYSCCDFCLFCYFPFLCNFILLVRVIWASVAQPMIRGRRFLLRQIQVRISCFRFLFS